MKMLRAEENMMAPHAFSAVQWVKDLVDCTHKAIIVHVRSGFLKFQSCHIRGLSTQGGTDTVALERALF
jgi:hypothetical protein